MADKRYPPSAKKLKKAREQGDVLKSRDLTMAVSLISGSICLYSVNNFFEIITDLFGKNLVTSTDFSTEIMLVSLVDALTTVRIVLLPLLFAVFIVVFLVEGLQTGFQLSFKPLAPDLSRFGFSKNISKIFGGGENEPFGVRAAGAICKFGLLVLCFGFVCAVIVFICVVEWVNAEQYLVHEMANAVRLSLIAVVVVVCGLCLVFGIVDYAVQAARRQKRLGMSAHELKREFRESEGSPELKDSRRRLHQEVVLHQLVQGVRKAKVLLIGNGCRSNYSS